MNVFNHDKKNYEIKRTTRASKNYFTNFNAVVMFMYIPLQLIPFTDSWYPSGHSHLTVPVLLLQVYSQFLSKPLQGSLSAFK